MWFESLLVFILFKFKKHPNISGIRVVNICIYTKCVCTVYIYIYIYIYIYTLCYICMCVYIKKNIIIKILFSACLCSGISTSKGSQECLLWMDIRKRKIESVNLVGGWVTLLFSIRPRTSVFLSMRSNASFPNKTFNSVLSLFHSVFVCIPSYLDHTTSTSVMQYTHLQSQRFIFCSPWAISHHTTIHTCTTDVWGCLLTHMHSLSYGY